MSNKEEYRKFCKENSDIPIFSLDWWLDAVSCNDDWDASIVEKNGVIIGTMPYVIRKKYGMTFLVMPPLTQTLGPWIRPSSGKYVDQESDQIKIMKELMEQIPQHSYFHQNFHYSITNHLPFYWEGFQQTTNYTYVIENLKDLKSIWNGMRPNITGDINKAQRRFNLELKSDLTIGDFLKISELTFRRQGKSLPYSCDVVHRIDDACQKHNCRKIFFAYDSQARIHSAAYIIWTSNTAYYLMGGSDPELRNSGANSLCLWEAIKFASTVANSFDFEGSMLEPVERFFRAFGARRMPYFQVTKTNSAPLRFAQHFRLI
jgi:hypothetical protein